MCFAFGFVMFKFLFLFFLTEFVGICQYGWIDLIGSSNILTKRKSVIEPKLHNFRYVFCVFNSESDEMGNGCLTSLTSRG